MSKTEQIAFHVPPELRKQYQEATVGLKKNDIAEALIRAFLKNPSIANVEALNSKPKTDDIGFVGGMWEIEYSTLAEAIEAAKEVQLRVYDFSFFWQARGIANAITNRVYDTDKSTKILFPRYLERFNVHVCKHVYQLAEQSKEDNFTVGVLLDGLFPIYNIHIRIDNTLYVGRGHLGNGPEHIQSYITVWRPPPDDTDVKLSQWSMFTRQTSHFDVIAGVAEHGDQRPEPHFKDL